MARFRMLLTIIHHYAGRSDSANRNLKQTWLVSSLQSGRLPLALSSRFPQTPVTVPYTSPHGRPR
jgi:hypothetical protein